MIVTELGPVAGGDALARAGRCAEEQMAFSLRCAFAEERQVLVFNDLRLARGGDSAQIDHLVLHRWGMVVVETKSVTSQVEVNERSEWTRYWDGVPRTPVSGAPWNIRLRQSRPSMGLPHGSATAENADTPEQEAHHCV